jgi:glycosyltransferase involved in cell wall biosynthesis
VSDIKFSILILSIPSRLDSLKALYAKLEGQIGDRKDIEVLTIVDNKKMTIGEKRNHALSLARGTYLAFLDDDDTVDDAYMTEIMKAIDTQPNVDVINFNQHCTVNGKTFFVFFGLSHPRSPQEQMALNPDGTAKDLRRPPYHMCVWKSIIAKNTPFDNSSWGEDSRWIEKLCQRSKTEHHIDKVLHYYQYSDQTSESIQHRK